MSESEDTTLCDVCGVEVPCDEATECECGLMLCCIHATDGRCPECDANRKDTEP